MFAWLASYFAISTNESSALLYLFTLVWGFMDGAVNTHTQQLLGFEFDTTTDPFSVYICMQSLACSLGILFESILEGDKYSLQVYTLPICLFGMLACGLTFFFDFKYKNSTEARNSMLIASVREGTHFANS